MKIESFVNELAGENGYLLTSDSGVTALVDAGSDVMRHLTGVRWLDAVLLTHAHFDHIIGLDSVVARFPEVRIFLHENEKGWFDRPELNASRVFGLDVTVAARVTDWYDEVVRLDDLELEVRQTPGHSIGGVSLYAPADGFVLSGDALFAGSIGRTDLPTGNHAQLLDSIRSQLLTLPDATRVLPGHGFATTIGQEKLSNPYL